jgi:hypothetical protein
MNLRYNKYSILFGLVIVVLLSSPHALSQTNDKAPSPPAEELTLVHAAMCEGIKDYSPINTAIIFSIDIGKISCFVSFDLVPEEMDIYHKWFHMDKLSTKKKLVLKPPRWSTFSSIQLREADKGPWRVEITDADENILHVLRFSIVD